MHEVSMIYTFIEETPEQQGLLASLIAKIINNLQVTIKNIHVRYEDKLSVPGVSTTYLRSLFAYVEHVFSIHSRRA